MTIKRYQEQTWLDTATTKVVDALCDLDDITADRPLAGKWTIKSEHYGTTKDWAYIEAYLGTKYVAMESITKVMGRSNLETVAAELYIKMALHEQTQGVAA